MDKSNIVKKITDSLNYAFGVRPDIAIIFIVLFILALLLCISLAKKNHLFYFSKKEPWKNLKDRELSQ